LIERFPDEQTASEKVISGIVKFGKACVGGQEKNKHASNTVSCCQDELLLKKSIELYGNGLAFSRAV